MKERGIVNSNHAPTNRTNSIVPTHANAHRQIRQLRRYSTHPDYEVDQFTAAMVEVATALRKAKRASKWERRLSA